MLKELVLLVTLLALFADARPEPSKVCDHRYYGVGIKCFTTYNPRLKDGVELSGEVNIEAEEEDDLIANRDDIVDGKSQPCSVEKEGTHVYCQTEMIISYLKAEGLMKSQARRMI